MTQSPSRGAKISEDGGSVNRRYQIGSVGLFIPHGDEFVALQSNGRSGFGEAPKLAREARALPGFSLRRFGRVVRHCLP